MFKVIVIDDTRMMAVNKETGQIVYGNLREIEDWLDLWENQE
jgi:hypothetical protein